MPERKPVTRKPSWVGGILLPCLAGIPAGYLLKGVHSSAALYGWYAFAAWQVMCGLAVIFERAPVYGATSVPQSRRVCELYGLHWLIMGWLTVVAAAGEGEEDPPSDLGVSVLAANLACTFGFSIAAGPTRLVNANDREMILVPINSFLVAWMTSSLYLSL